VNIDGGSFGISIGIFLKEANAIEESAESR